jgi:hypothetical protein
LIAMKQCQSEKDSKIMLRAIDSAGLRI